MVKDLLSAVNALDKEMVWIKILTIRPGDTVEKYPDFAEIGSIFQLHEDAAIWVGLYIKSPNLAVIKDKALREILLRSDLLHGPHRLPQRLNLEYLLSFDSKAPIGSTILCAVRCFPLSDLTI